MKLHHFIQAFLLLLFFATCKQTQNINASRDSTSEKIRLSDEALFTKVQQHTFQYFWDGAEPNSGLARERFHADGIYPQNDKNIVTSGGSGFGLMAILTGIHNKFITREQGVQRLQKILSFLEKADRFHGAWPHWMYGESGKVKPFSPNDDGGDLVETSFLAAGLICVREYFEAGNSSEKMLAQKADQLWREIDWDWYRGAAKENVLFWHWSPNFGWEKEFRIRGYNECLITYVLAACSPTHAVPPEVYHEGWAENGAIKSNLNLYGYPLTLRHQGTDESCGPLFWAHYSYLGLDPRGLKDKYADYWGHNVNHVKMVRAYCMENPKNYPGYGENSWGLTSSYALKGYSSHKPEQDEGTIAPTAALASFPYAPEECKNVMRHFHDELGNSLFGEYGFYDCFNELRDWFPRRYLAIDQGPIVVMMENHKSGLLWDLFMSAPEVQAGLEKLEFEFNKP